MKTHAGLRAASLLLALLLCLTLLPGCGGEQKNYHTITVNGTEYLILDREYEGEMDLRLVRFLYEPQMIPANGETVAVLEGDEAAEDFRLEEVLDREDYLAFCESWGLTPAFPDHTGRFAVLAYAGEFRVVESVQVADALVEGDTLRLLMLDRMLWTGADTQGFLLTLPVPDTVTKLEIVPVYNQQEEENFRRWGSPSNPETQYPEKPVIYLYPETETAVTVKLDYDGELSCTYPAYENGWSVTAAPDGTLTDAAGQSYSYLYWEGRGEAAWDYSRGFCVRGADTAAFLEEALAKLGLTRREANEFIVYWLPQMQDNPWNLIAFQGAAYTERARLSVEPAPDTVLRVFMAWKPLEVPVDVPPQALTAPERTGFTLVEWGGAKN